MGTTDPDGQPFGPDAYIFGNVVGRRIVSVKTAWKTACQHAQPKITGLRFHDLRHEAGSRLLERNWPLHNVQAMLGHANIKTASTYLNITLPGCTSPCGKATKPGTVANSLQTRRSSTADRSQRARARGR